MAEVEHCRILADLDDAAADRGPDSVDAAASASHGKAGRIEWSIC
jgi:hypothetical protein